MTTCYLGLGSNLGDRGANLHAAVYALAREVGSVTAASRMYETAPWGDSPVESYPYLNAVVEVSTGLPPKHLLLAVQDIERRGGRQRSVPNAPRTLDIDVLFYGSETLDTLALSLPHPKLHLRRFVLAPLAEIAPDFRHPKYDATALELLARCSDPLIVTAYGS